MLEMPCFSILRKYTGYGEVLMEENTHGGNQDLLINLHKGEKNMRAYMLIAILLVILLFIGCMNSDSDYPSNEMDGNSKDTENLYGIEPPLFPDYVPMPVTYTSEILNPDFAYYWHLFSYFYDRSDPPERGVFNMNYTPEIDRLTASIVMSYGRFNYTYSSVQPLVDFSDFLAQYENPFFDHSEFNLGVESELWHLYILDLGCEEFFIFRTEATEATEAIGDRDVAHAIIKWVEPDGPPEIVEAMEQIRLLFTDEVLGQSPQNQPPVCDFTATPNPYTGIGPAVIEFDASGSYDPDGGIVSYEWEFHDGGNATGEHVTYSYFESGSYPVTLTVTDNDGKSTECSDVVIIIIVAPPW